MSPAHAIFAAFVAGSLLAAFDTLWVLVVEREQAPGYFAWCAFLLISGATTLGALLGLARAPAAVLAAALGAAGAALILPGWPPPLIVGLGLAIVAGLLTPRTAPPWRLATAVTVALGVAAVLAPRVLVRLLDWESLAASLRGVVLAGLVVAIVAGLELLGRWLQRGPQGARRARGLSLASAAALLLSPLLALATADDEPRPPAAPEAAGAIASPPSPHVVLLVLDTVRADHLGLYGYERATTPRLAALLERLGRGAVLPAVFSDGSWTVPSHASLFTGLRPGEHGAHFTPGNSFFFDIDEHETLAERLREVGYRTIGVWANPWLGRVGGMGRGFDVYLRPEMPNRLPPFGEPARRWLTPGIHPQVMETERGDLVLERLEQEIAACGSSPCFAFANLLDAHAYYVPELCRGRFADWSVREVIRLPSIHDTPEQIERFEARYDEEICDLDTRLADFFEGLERRGLLDDTWVFVTSDHGEAFAEHGSIEHGSSVYDEQVRIPLIVIPPAGASIAADPGPATLVDVAATVAAVAGTSLPGSGRDLREPTEPGSARAAMEFYGDPTKVADRNPRAADPARAVVVGDWKLVEQSGRLELFDLARDPRERLDLADRHPERVDALLPLLPALVLGEARPRDDETIPPEVLEQLRQLGYGH